MKYEDLKYCLNNDFPEFFSQPMHFDNIKKIRKIALSKKLFYDLSSELCEIHEIYDEFEYDNIIFCIDEIRGYDYYAVVYIFDSDFGYGYEILSEAERAIKNILE